MAYRARENLKKLILASFVLFKLMAIFSENSNSPVRDGNGPLV